MILERSDTGIMATDSFLQSACVFVPIVDISVTIASDYVFLGGGNFSSCKGIEKVFPLIFTDRFIHFQIK